MPDKRLSPDEQAAALNTLVSMLSSQKGAQPPIFSLPDLFRPIPTVQGQWFSGATVCLDGYILERWRFDRCRLVSERATFVLRQCFISPDCGLVFVGDALKIARLLMHTLVHQGRLVPQPEEQGALAQINPDGTFTLE